MEWADTSQTLADLQPGQVAILIRLAVGGSLRQRLLDLGFVPGTAVRALGPGPLGDPLAFAARHTVIALRRDDARRIFVTRPSGSGRIVREER